MKTLDPLSRPMEPRTDQRSTRSTDRSVAGRAVALFSPKFFLFALLAFGGALVAGNTVVPFVPVVGGLVGLLAVAFLLGLVVDRRRYAEVGVAGAVSSAAVTFLGNIFLSVVGNVGVPLALVGAGGGLIAALVGYYLGRDLRTGLTREL